MDFQQTTGPQLSFIYIPIRAVILKGFDLEDKWSTGSVLEPPESREPPPIITDILKLGPETDLQRTLTSDLNEVQQS